MRWTLIVPTFFMHSLVSAATIKLCGGTNYFDCTNDFTPANGNCYNVQDLYNDRVEAVRISGGNCVFWANAGCSGDHTNQVFGDNPNTGTMCSGGWQTRISSFKCCGSNTWCAGSQPKCT
ncbi:hypothetical protein BKA70DRAFT_1222068 [Coprinopsis sp. MPI-PUGE-AT-0042]|nr:hypothetical protein BKA70DRAFT_1222068 [Coprinopsis sp. MPI-PUGE-AT-0042]